MIETDLELVRRGPGDLGTRTFRDVVPERGVQGIVGAPSGDAGAVRRARTVLVLVRRSKLKLVVKLGERVDVSIPAAKDTTRHHPP